MEAADLNSDRVETPVYARYRCGNSTAGGRRFSEMTGKIISGGHEI